MTLKPRKYTHYHKDGTVWAKGQKTGEVMTGYWRWFRKDGTMMRSGSFTDTGEQTGEWTTYDQRGKAFKVTMIKTKAAKVVAKKTRKTAAKVSKKKKRAT
jgi:antitoxin component YwqK of YwqJK toxin-antitoxin module